MRSLKSELAKLTPALARTCRRKRMRMLHSAVPQSKREESSESRKILIENSVFIAPQLPVSGVSNTNTRHKATRVAKGSNRRIPDVLGSAAHYARMAVATCVFAPHAPLPLASRK